MIDRRGVLRLGALGLTMLGMSRVVAHLATAELPLDDADEFTEVYKGRRIRVTAGSRPAGGPSGRVAAPPRVFIDDAELHLISTAAGYATAMNHYQTFRTARLAARAAVDGLRGASLLAVHK